MLITEKSVVCAFGARNILTFRTKKTVKVAALKYHQQEKLENFKSASLASARFSGYGTSVLTNATARKQTVYIESFYSIYKGNI